MKDRASSIWLAAMARVLCAMIAAAVVAASAAFAGTTRTVAPGGDFEPVYAQAQDGDTIVIGEGTMLNESTVSGIGDAPFLIDKAITIKGAAPGTFFQVRRGGFILGADVVFKDMEIGFGNPRRSSIIANGHSLTLENVKRRSGNRAIHVFAGGYVHHPNYSYQTKVPQAGDHGSITILGDTNIEGNIYLGGMNTTYSGRVSLKFDATAGAKFSGKLYSLGASETFVADPLALDPSQFDVAPPTQHERYATSGTVSIELNDPSNKATFDCVTGGLKNAQLTIVEGSSVISPTVIKPSTLALKLGQSTTSSVKLAAASVLTDGIGISIPASCALNLQDLTTLPRVNAFSGGGTLVLGREQTIYIDGTVGGQTRFRTGDGSGGYATGFVVDGHKYIVAPKSNGNSFLFTPEVSTQSTMTLEYSATDGSWTAKKPAVVGPTKIASFTLDKAVDTFTTAQVNHTNGVEIDFSYDLNNDGDLEIDDVPITVEITKGSAYWSANPSGTKGNYYATVTQANMKFTWGATGDGVGSFYLYADGGAIAAGTYNITFTIPRGSTSTGSDLAASFTLTVTDSSQPPAPKKYRVTVTSDGTGATGDGEEHESGDKVTIYAGAKAGHDFKQWNASGTPITDLTATQARATFTMPDGPVTLTAEWTPITQPTYSVTLDGTGDGASGGGSYTSGVTVNINAGTKSGHTFAGWQSSGAAIADLNTSQASTTFTMPTGDVVLTATWTPNAPSTYGVTLNDTGTGASGTGSYAAGARVSINAGSKSGYTFAGWQSSGAAISDLNASQASTSFTMPAGDVVLTATWTPTPPSTYGVTLDGTGTGASGTGSYAAGARVSINAGSKSGHTFAGWQSSGAAIADLNASQSSTTFTMPAGAVVLTATWTPITQPPSTYGVTLNGTGAGASGAGSYAAGARVSINAGSKSGYTFAGWQSSGAAIAALNASQASTSFTMPAGAVVLTATWTQNMTLPVDPDVPPTPQQPDAGIDDGGRGKYTERVDKSVSSSRWEAAGTRGLTVRVDVDYSRFRHFVTLGGRALIEGIGYTSYSGSTVIEIKPAALRQIQRDGEHEVEVHFVDGTAVHRFTAITSQGDGSGSQPQQPGGSGSGGGGGGCASTGGAAALIFAAAALILRKRKR